MMRLLLISLLSTLPTTSAVAQSSDVYLTTISGRAVVANCPTSDLGSYKICLREQRVVRAARALNDILVLSLDDGGLQGGGAADCAATAEADCGSTLDDVDSLEYNDGICVWTCKAFAVEPSGTE